MLDYINIQFLGEDLRYNFLKQAEEWPKNIINMSLDVMIEKTTSVL